MSDWTHPICEPCWAIEVGRGNVPGSEPARLEPEMRTRETCCLCHNKTRCGIYVRLDPVNTPCKGRHPETVAS